MQAKIFVNEVNGGKAIENALKWSFAFKGKDLEHNSTSGLNLFIYHDPLQC